MSETQRIPVTIFCGSKEGSDPSFMQDVGRLGAALAIQGFDIVYGGSDKGLMGELANHALSRGAKVVGVIPEVLIAWEHQHGELSELIITKDMHDRKRTMYEMGRAGIVLPGGFGTLDEMFEMLTWNQLSIHDKKIYILNSSGFYDHLILHLQQLNDKGFLYDPVWERIEKFNDPESLVKKMTSDLKN